MLISKSTFLIRGLCKIYKCLLHQIAREIMLLRIYVSNVHEKTSQKVKTDEILKACA